jgi:hypothetical protein
MIKDTLFHLIEFFILISDLSYRFTLQCVINNRLCFKVAFIHYVSKFHYGKGSANLIFLQVCFKRDLEDFITEQLHDSFFLKLHLHKASNRTKVWDVEAVYSQLKLSLTGVFASNFWLKLLKTLPLLVLGLIDEYLSLFLTQCGPEINISWVFVSAPPSLLIHYCYLLLTFLFHFSEVSFKFLVNFGVFGRQRLK